MSRMVEVSGMEMMYSSVSFRRADRAQKEATLVDSKVLEVTFSLAAVGALTCVKDIGGVNEMAFVGAAAVIDI